MHSGLELLSREVDTQKHFIAVNRLLGRLRSSHFGGANHIIVLLKVQGLAIASAVAVADCGLRRLGLPGFGTAGVRTGRGLLMTAILLAGLQMAVLIAQPKGHGHQRVAFAWPGFQNFDRPGFAPREFRCQNTPGRARTYHKEIGHRPAGSAQSRNNAFVDATVD